jgi:hypothetical protein
MAMRTVELFPVNRYGSIVGFNVSVRPTTCAYRSGSQALALKASRQYGMSKTVYVELALKDRFKKDGI